MSRRHDRKAPCCQCQLCSVSPPTILRCTSDQQPFDPVEGRLTNGQIILPGHRAERRSGCSLASEWINDIVLMVAREVEKLIFDLI